MTDLYQISEQDLLALETRDRTDLHVYPAGRDSKSNIAPLGEFFEFSDDTQPVYGYFVGGGWDFGTIETQAKRASPQSYINYLNLQPDGTFQVIYVNDNTPFGSTQTVTFQTTDPNGQNYIPPFASLSPFDQLAVLHDQAHAITADELARGQISFETSLRENLEADQRLLAGVNALSDTDISGSTAIQTEYYRVERQWLVSGLSAAIPLESTLLNVVHNLGVTDLSGSEWQFLAYSNLFSSQNNPDHAVDLLTTFLKFTEAFGAENSDVSAGTTVDEVVVTASISQNRSVIAKLFANGTLDFSVFNNDVASATVQVTAAIVGQFSFDDSSVQVSTEAGATTTIANATGTLTVTWGGQSLSAMAGGQATLSSSSVIIDNSGDGVGTTYTLGSGGTLTTIGPGYTGQQSDSISTAESSATSALNSVSASVSQDTTTGSIDNSIITNVVARDLSGVPLGQNPSTTDPTGAVVGGAVISTSDTLATDPSINTDGVFNNSPGGVLSGYDRPGNQMLSPTSDNLDSLLDNSATIDYLSSLYGAYIADVAGSSPSYLDIDPLVLDLNGDGINLSNWIDNDVYFDTNVVPDPSNSGKVVADGELHHTSWVNADDGMLVFESGGGSSAITDITQTVSEFFRGNVYDNSFAALASLAQAGATVFSRDTALVDPDTGVSYFDEIKIWQDANQDGLSQAGELKSLDSLGIVSISLMGGPNTGASINGSSVTSQADYTTASGNTYEAASIDLQTSTTGDITSTSGGGVVIQSYSEGSPTPATTFVAENASAHTYTLSDGVLIDQTTGQTVASGVNAVLSTDQGDTIEVSSGDTTAYWLGGGTGADTLVGGAGNTVFLVNADTTVHGGTGFNIAKVVDSGPVNIDLATSNLQEVIGGDGGGVFNASGTTWNVFIQGGAGNNIMIGGAANDALSGGTGDDLIKAGTGGSVIHAGSGNDIIYGGSGSLDPAIPEYANAGASSNDGFVSRLYNAGLGREADLSGFQTYVTELNNGSASLTDVATAFVTSAEWQTRYGTQTDAQFVTSIFENFVGRAPEASELTDFTQALSEGASRGDILEDVADDPASQAYWGSKHPGASDLIYGGPRPGYRHPGRQQCRSNRREWLHDRGRRYRRLFGGRLPWVFCRLYRRPQCGRLNHSNKHR